MKMTKLYALSLFFLCVWAVNVLASFPAACLPPAEVGPSGWYASGDTFWCAPISCAFNFTNKTINYTISQKNYSVSVPSLSATGTTAYYAGLCAANLSSVVPASK